MSRGLGFFTCYGIEYVYDFLGKQRISNKILELKDQPTMGIRFEDFVYDDPNYSYANEKGIFWVFTLILDWFKDDIDLHFSISANSGEDLLKAIEQIYLIYEAVLNSKSKFPIQDISSIVLIYDENKWKILWGYSKTGTEYKWNEINNNWQKRS